MLKRVQNKYEPALKIGPNIPADHSHSRSSVHLSCTASLTTNGSTDCSTLLISSKHAIWSRITSEFGGTTCNRNCIELPRMDYVKRKPYRKVITSFWSCFIKSPNPHNYQTWKTYEFDNLEAVKSDRDKSCVSTSWIALELVLLGA
ncbi:hypothetical protein CEXT_326501 [Caerostris extrusa]|uniref:Uncharacterized protein n=1 Tax=Caerostris extrusa TaxID=172846 RepID=A0AAV4XAW0_CAEEX|nr:hypothetical protein CEXT_326501 [Caerostris extrusa]